MRITGTSEDDLKTGTAVADRFFLEQGGDDTVSGLEGNDKFQFGGGFSAADVVSGGDGHDHLLLEGDYAAGVVFGAATMSGIERIRLGGAFDYNLTIDDATVVAGTRLYVEFLPGAGGGQLVFDGSAETDGRLLMRGGGGGDSLTGGGLGDQFDLGAGGADTADGGRGFDRFILGAAFGADDRIDGGAGRDRAELNGAYANLSITGTMLSHVEVLTVAGGHGAIALSFADDVVAEGRTLNLDASQLGAAEALFFNGSSETDGAYNAVGGAGGDYLGGGFGGGGDTLIGGGGDDTIEGWSGADDITVGAGADVFFNKGVEFSTGSSYDTIRDVDFDEDYFSLDTPTAIDAAVTGADLSAATFNPDLEAALTGALGLRHAVLVTAGSGDLNGHTFLVVEVGGGAGYQADADYVFDITGYTGTFDLSDFI